MKVKFSLSRMVEQVSEVEMEVESLEEAKKLTTMVDWDCVAEEQQVDWDTWNNSAEDLIVTHINGNPV